jgi:hypothetical protein
LAEKLGKVLIIQGLEAELRSKNSELEKISSLLDDSRQQQTDLVK